MAGSFSRLGEPLLVVTGLSWVIGVEQKIFMQESDASNFLKKRSKRSPKSQEEVNGKDAAAPSGSFSAQQLDRRDCKGPTAHPRSFGITATAAAIENLHISSIAGHICDYAVRIRNKKGRCHMHLTLRRYILVSAS